VNVYKLCWLVRFDSPFVLDLQITDVDLKFFYLFFYL